MSSPTAPASVRLLALVLLLGGCSATPGEPEPTRTSLTEVDTMELTSPAFGEGATIPVEHTCDGDDTSPPLEWSGTPDGTAAFALLVTDPDARGFVHWVLNDIPADASGLPAGEGDTIGTPGRNGFGRIGWAGPCPPSGAHRYVFTLYALDEPLALSGTPDAASVESGLEGHALAEATLSAVFARGG